jgi:hypothetical protein
MESSHFAHGHRSESLKLGYCAPNRKTDTGCHLVQLDHIVCEEYHHGSIVWVGLPPSAVCTRPTYRADTTTAAQWICLLWFCHDRDPEAIPVACR